MSPRKFPLGPPGVPGILEFKADLGFNLELYGEVDLDLLFE